MTTVMSALLPARQQTGICAAEADQGPTKHELWTITMHAVTNRRNNRPLICQKSSCHVKAIMLYMSNALDRTSRQGSLEKLWRGPCSAEPQQNSLNRHTWGLGTPKAKQCRVTQPQKTSVGGGA
jgi:hypothetical protein